MLKIDELQDFLLTRTEEITQKWLDDRKDDGTIFSKDVSDEVTKLLREENSEFVMVLTKSFVTDNQIPLYITWANEISTKRAQSQTALHYSLESFRSFRLIYWEYLVQFAEQKNITLSELGKLGEIFNSTYDHIIELFAITFEKAHQEILKSQREMITELSSPVISLTKNIGLLPIVGDIDTYRAKIIKEKTLEQSSQLLLTHLIIDLTGVLYIDTMVANEIYQLVDMLSLIGVEVSITGIRPEIAQTSVQLGLDFRNIHTYSSLQQILPILLKDE